MSYSNVYVNGYNANYNYYTYMNVYPNVTAMSNPMASSALSNAIADVLSLPRSAVSINTFNSYGYLGGTNIGSQTSPYTTATLTVLYQGTAQSTGSPPTGSPVYNGGVWSPPSPMYPTGPSPVSTPTQANTPTAYTPTAYTPTAYTPTAYTPTAYTPTAYTPTAYTPVAFQTPTAMQPSTVSTPSTESSPSIPASSSGPSGSSPIAAPSYGYPTSGGPGNVNCPPTPAPNNGQGPISAVPTPPPLASDGCVHIAFIALQSTLTWDYFSVPSFGNPGDLIYYNVTITIAGGQGYFGSSPGPYGSGNWPYLESQALYNFPSNPMQFGPFSLASNGGVFFSFYALNVGSTFRASVCPIQTVPTARPTPLPVPGKSSFTLSFFAKILYI